MGWVEDQRAKQAAKAAAAKAAEQAAAAGSTNGSTNGSAKPHGPPADLGAYIEAGVAKQLQILRDARPGTERTRNTTLFVSAKALGQLEAVDRDWLHEQLIEACGPIVDGGNDLIADDGEPQCQKTIRSGYRTADAEGFRTPDPGYFDRINVQEVPLSAFTVTINGAGKAQVSGPDDDTGDLLNLEPVMARIIAAECDFWDRLALRRIWDEAMAQMVPPWSVLAHCAGRAIAMVPVRILLPAVIGGRRGGSMNWFAALVGDSGLGKSTAADLAEELVPGYYDAVTGLTYPLERNVGSGEGIVQAFVRKAAKGGATPAKAEYHDSVLFTADEVDTLTAQGSRQGSTTLPILRTAFTGGTLGFAYAKTTNNNHLPKHSYRLVFMLSGQPSRFGPLLADGVGGTPQRFQWFPSFDLRMTDADGVGPMPPLWMPARGDWQNVTTLEIPPEARMLIRSTRLSTGKGRGGLSSHAVFVREKFAQALALLDGRVTMTSDDWRLSGIAAEVSQITRDWVLEQLAGAQEREDAMTGMRRAVVDDARDIEKARRGHSRRCDMIADWIRGKLAKGPMKQSDLHRAQRSTDRELTLSVLDALVAEGHVERKKNTKGTVWVQLSKLQ